jgi:hypothetical protein
MFDCLFTPPPSRQLSTLFEALYGCAPPLISEVLIDSLTLDFLTQKQQMLQKLKGNLAQAHMKNYVDLKRSDRKFRVGDMVYLKLQPFRQTAFGIHKTLKLATKFFGPFRVLEKIGNAAYRLQLPDTTDNHHVFHVSQLKQHIGPKAIPQDNLPLVTPDRYIKIGPLAVLDTRALSRRNEIVTQCLIQWENMSPDQAMWEDNFSLKQHSQPFIITLCRNGGLRLPLVDKSKLLRGAVVRCQLLKPT